MPRLTPLLFAALLALPACQRSEDALPPPAYGTATCATCQATIAAPRFAAQLQRADGTVLSFDDPACLFAALAKEPDPPRRIRFHDGSEDGWIDAESAWFAKAPGVSTPHGDGWVAYPTFAAAQDAVAAAGSGEILPFAQVRTRTGG